MDRQTTRDLIEMARKKLAKEFGVTVVEDHSGEFGPLGATYLTIRWSPDEKTGELIEIFTQILKVD